MLLTFSLPGETVLDPLEPVFGDVDPTQKISRLRGNSRWSILGAKGML